MPEVGPFNYHLWCGECNCVFYKMFLVKFKFLMAVKCYPRFPIDWHNPIGFLFPVVWLSIVTFLVLLFLSCMPSLAFGAFLLALAFVEDWKDDLRAINEMAKTKQPNVDILKRINGLVRSYTNVKQLSLLFSTLICFSQAKIISFFSVQIDQEIREYL